MATLNATASTKFVALLIITTLARACFADLRVGFYNGKCGENDVEAIVYQVVKAKFVEDPTIVASLLIMQFHDCFVRGCDGSILLDGPKAEKNGRGNKITRGYDLIDAVKDALEKACPQVVSCADIIAIATRVAVNLAGGRWYEVETGRRDGRVSLASEADAVAISLGPSTPVPNVIKGFADRGIGKEDLVLLLGAHTVGVTHCLFVQGRLYNFNGTVGRTDPSINPSFVPILKKACPSDGDGSKVVSLDHSRPGSTAEIVDNGYYKTIVAHKGVTELDQKLALDESTKYIVAKYAVRPLLFQVKFGQAMVKMGRIGVLNGTQGEVRKACRFVN